mmetsp:Transcript_21641/g.21295  ORF Transcript_21641/g.21295 Transcript_21641/m.21295 type:complete len:140 (+) Transcript_21641:810-1229(+)
MKHQIDILEESIPDKYDDGIVITENDNISEFEINDNMAVNNRTLGKCRFKLMTAYYQYKRKKARWISTAERTCSNMLSMEDCNEIYIQRNKSSILDYVKEIVRKVKKSTQPRDDIYNESQEENQEFVPKIFPKPQSPIR